VSAPARRRSAALLRSRRTPARCTRRRPRRRTRRALHTGIERIFRAEGGRVVASLVGRFGEPATAPTMPLFPIAVAAFPQSVDMQFIHRTGRSPDRQSRAATVE
jgi:hypothetical protein